MGNFLNKIVNLMWNFLNKTVNLMGNFLNKTVNFNVISVVACFKCDEKHNNILLRTTNKQTASEILHIPTTVLGFVDRAFLYNLVNRTTLVHNVVTICAVVKCNGKVYRKYHGCLHLPNTVVGLLNRTNLVHKFS